ncbi:MAG TPA: hypothetical protein VLF65_07240 [Burkholderiales bacterium]|nr:hypothetical protein [Burkholderiales bacterium]
MRAAIIVCLLGASLPGFACDYPNEGGMPLRRAVTRVEMLPEVDAWARSMQQNGIKPQYVVKLNAPVREGKRCYWPVEVRAGGWLWRRYLVTPDGKNVLLKE